MHRFGRSGQLKKDRWGGSFILVAALALGAAYFTGQYLQDTLWGGKPAANQTQDNDLTGAGLGENLTPTVTVEPAAFNLYVVQVGAFKSPTSAQNLANQINAAGEVGFANVNTKGLSYAYAGGVFMDKAKAMAAKDEMLAAKVITDGYVATLKVPYGPDAITAMAGESKSTVGDGYSKLNTYLQEVALWIQNRADGASDPVTDMVSLGKSLGTLAADLEKANLTDERMKEFINVAKEASLHAEMLQSAGSTMNTSSEYMKALNGYVSLLAHYNSLQANTTAANQ